MLACLSLVIALQDPVPVLSDRLAFGKRYQRAEITWMQTPDLARRSIATAKMNEAVLSFFGGNFAKGCKATDLAIAALEGRKWSPLDGVEVRLTRRVISKGGSAEVEYGWAYPPEPGTPEVKFTCAGKPVTLRAEDTPKRIQLEPQSAELTLLDGTWVKSSFVVQPAYEGKDFRPLYSDSKMPMAKELLEFLEEQAEVKKLESQPSLKKFDQDLALADKGDFLGMSQIRRTNFEGTVLRSTIPQKGVKEVTLVVGLHGAGGSENFFFEAYGVGLGPKLAQDRGWVFVAPRTSGKAVERSVEFVEKTFGVKVAKLLIMGHSMGGGTAIAFNNAALPLKAVAVFAPAGQLLSNVVAKVPTYLAIGKQDMAMLTTSASRLKPQVLATPKGYFKEFDPCEHTMVVPDAISEAYAFFDIVLKR